MRALLGAVLLFGCGPDFEGQWKGTLQVVATCSDGSSDSKTSDVSWAIVETSPAVLVVTPATGTCGSFDGTAQGNVVTMTPRSCPAVSGATSNAFTGGTLVMTTAGVMNVVSFSSRVTFPNGNCGANVTGTLLKK